MADWIDESQEHQLRLLEEQIAKVTQTRHGASALFCEDCDTPIPEQRRSAIYGVRRCIECQEINEIKSRNYRQI